MRPSKKQRVEIIRNYEPATNLRTNMRTVIKPEKVIYPELSYKLNGVLFKVRKDLGQFCNERQYCDAIETELQRLGIAYEREKVLPASFQGEREGRNKIDFLIEDKIILEVKAKQFAGKEDYYQLKRYLEAFKLELGILVNMRRYYIQPKRVLNVRKFG